MVIWKFPIYPDEFKVEATMSLRVLSTGVQVNRPVFWAALDPKDPKCTFVFRSVMTGEEIPAEIADHALWTFCGTVEVMSGIGPIVTHLFQRCKVIPSHEVRRER